MKKITLFILTFNCLFLSNAFAVSPAINANPATTENQWWLNLGLGLGGTVNHSDFGGGSALISGSYRLSEHQILSARFLRTTRLFFDKSNFTDAGILYGLIAKGNYGYISGSTGLSFAQYDLHEGNNIKPLRNPEHHVRTTNTIGIPIQLNLFWTPTKHVGLGIIGFGDINSAKTISGVALALQFGNWD